MKKNLINNPNFVPLFTRRSIRLKNYDYSQPGAYFITICSFKGHDIFGKIQNDEMDLNECGGIVREEWISIGNSQFNIELDEYVIMPDHFHGIIHISPGGVGGTVTDRADGVGVKNVGVIHELPLRLKSQSQKNRRKMLIPTIIGKFKMLTAKKINIHRKSQGIPVWQRNYYERIIRDGDELNRVRHYIKNNPGAFHELPLLSVGG